jgi:hypothetical protein
LNSTDSPLLGNKRMLDDRLIEPLLQCHSGAVRRPFGDMPSSRADAVFTPRRALAHALTAAGVFLSARAGAAPRGDHSFVTVKKRLSEVSADVRADRRAVAIHNEQLQSDPDPA